ncbi:HD domain-containing protein [Luteibacter sp. 329MFSha]|uniref:HD domain-containing protein n=1 Tax=Luteibacter sp. 329MFSha TaxID=1798239 RepID=UPI0008CC3F34|nr:HD domain-containing protein [Luteibacter sp. 329MFSha]SEV92634.1 HD domain-containing protein [Luteibacter sp. 329MFSha]
MLAPQLPEIHIPDSPLAQQAIELIRDCESELLFLHSMRVYAWGALAGRRDGLVFDPELLLVGALFHDLGLVERFRGSTLRFEVDGANAARDFLVSHGVAGAEVDKVWAAIALHTTPGIPQFMHAEAALLHMATGMDVAGRAYDQFTDAERSAVTNAWPRGTDFNQAIIDTFYDGLRHRPDSTFGTFNDDFLAAKDPHFQRVDLCSMILQSPWAR